MIAVELREHLPRRIFRREIVARREDMGGIKANAKPLGLAHIAHDVRDMLEPIAETGALASGRLERDPRFRFLRQAGVTASIEATIFSRPASSPAPRCAPGCRTRNGSSS